MGFFDRFKGASATPMTPADHVVVPDGHELTLHQALTDPGVVTTRGGVVLANLGMAGDDTEHEMAGILAEVEAALRMDAPPARLVAVHAQMPISALFAPHELDTVSQRTPVSWIFHQGAVTAIAARPRLLQQFFRAVHESRVRGFTAQTGYIVDPPSPVTQAFARLLRGLGFEVKQPTATQGGVVLVEVKRPDGIVSALGGQSYPDDGSKDMYARKANEEKDRAETARDETTMRRLEDEERIALGERIGRIDDAALLPLRGPRLRRMILDLVGSNDDAMTKFAFALMERATPLLFIHERDRGGMELRGYGAVGSALTLFSDMRCLHWAAHDLGKAQGFAVAGIAPRQLVAMAANGNVGLAIGTFRDRSSPVYAVLSSTVVQSVAKSAGLGGPTSAR